MAAVTFPLPYPPSANNLFPGKARRYPSKAYVAWRKLAEGMVPTISLRGPYEIDLAFDRPDRRARDLGNLEKAISDLLVAKGVVEDDRLCERMLLAWTARAPGKGAMAHVTLKARAS